MNIKTIAIALGILFGVITLGFWGVHQVRQANLGSVEPASPTTIPTSQSVTPAPTQKDDEEEEGGTPNTQIDKPGDTRTAEPSTIKDESEQRDGGTPDTHVDKPGESKQ